MTEKDDIPEKDIKNLEKHLKAAGRIMNKHNLILICGAGVAVLTGKSYAEQGKKRIDQDNDVVLNIPEADFPSDGGDIW